MNSSGEELFVKTRKPYTITKQRERWTEEEHGKFLEALKLYGRAWQRIEEHIGTKTAVQIRSHAQKFFTKLEKESLTKGVQSGHAHDIYIPPPRPKRKPSNPYPRKTCLGATNDVLGAKDGKPMTSVSSSCPSRQSLDLENEPPPEESPGTERSHEAKETTNNGNIREVIDVFQEPQSSCIASARKSTSNGLTARNESALAVEAKENQKVGITDGNDTDLNVGRKEPTVLEKHLNHKDDNSVPRESKTEAQQQEKLASLPSQSQKTLNHPTQISVNIVNASTGKCMNTSPSEKADATSISHYPDDKGNQNQFPFPPISPTTEQHVNSGRSSVHPFLPFPHPTYTLFCNKDDSYQTFLNISSTFSNLILSALLQNPAVHASATMAASFWPCIDGSSPDTFVGGYPVRPTGQSPSLAAIVGATVAAASAWWASHGLLPFCPPVHAGFAFTYPATAGITTTEITHASKEHEEIIDGGSQLTARKEQPVEPEFSTAVKKQVPGSKSSSFPHSDSEESGGLSLHAVEKKASSHGQSPVPCSEMPDTDKGKGRKPFDRSSCGSNTTSSSEIEKDASEKHEEARGESKQVELIHPACELINRRCRNNGTNMDSWKEVSEEGRLAFQALFSREVLPQSFSPPHALRNHIHPNISYAEQKQISNKSDNIVVFDLRNKSCSVSQDNSVCIQKSEQLTNGDNGKGLLTNTFAGHGKMKGCRTGFQPYKRCSMEANESSVANSTGRNEEGSKRIRLEGEAST